VIITCWSTKGGSGTTVVTAALAAVLASDTRHNSGVLAVDAAPPHSFGDLAAVLGSTDHASTPANEHAVNDRLSVLAIPTATSIGGQPELASHISTLTEDDRTVVIDAGSARTDPQQQFAQAAARSLLVVRPCYLTLRRLAGESLSADGVVLIEEPGRALRREDVEAVLGLPVLARINLDPAIARIVDSGLLVSRVPRQLNALRQLPWN
jgi:hypothetical protein